MKKATFFTGSFFTSVTLIAILFKVMHWPTAGILLVTGVIGLALIFIPLYTFNRYNKSNDNSVESKV